MNATTCAMWRSHKMTSRCAQLRWKQEQDRNATLAEIASMPWSDSGAESAQVCHDVFQISLSSHHYIIALHWHRSAIDGVTANLTLTLTLSLLTCFIIHPLPPQSEQLQRETSITALTPILCFSIHVFALQGSRMSSSHSFNSRNQMQQYKLNPDLAQTGIALHQMGFSGSSPMPHRLTSRPAETQVRRATFLVCLLQQSSLTSHGREPPCPPLDQEPSAHTTLDVNSCPPPRLPSFQLPSAQPAIPCAGRAPAKDPAVCLRGSRGAPCSIPVCPRVLLAPYGTPQRQASRPLSPIFPHLM